MAFPEDYRRVQMAGGIEADVAVQVGLPRQILVDVTNLNLRLMDGVTQGGHVVQMEKDLDENVQLIPNFEGEVEYVETGTDTPGEADQRKRLWKASKLRNLFLKLADITLVDSTYVWAIKNSVLPSRIRTNASLILDPNTATMSGWSRIAPGSANMPADAPSAGTVHLMLEVISQSESDLIQLLYARDGTGRIWMRPRADGIWGAWVLATGLTSVDLDTRLAKAGDSMTGKLTLAPSTNVRPALNLLAGDDVTAPADGDLWRNAATGLRLRKGGTTRTILDSENGVQFTKDNSGAFGADMTVIDRTGTRAANTTYQNMTNKTIMVIAGGYNSSGADFAASVQMRIGQTSGALKAVDGQDMQLNRTYIMKAFVPPGWYYQFYWQQALTLSSFTEIS